VFVCFLAKTAWASPFKENTGNSCTLYSVLDDKTPKQQQQQQKTNKQTKTKKQETTLHRCWLSAALRPQKP